VIASSALPTASIRASRLLASALRNMPFSLLKASSMGFRSADRVGRQVQQLAAPLFDEFSDAISLVGGEVIHNHDLS
jgi:hypothetical protein